MPDGPVTTAASSGAHRRNPFLAAALSALLPGVGQAYNGERAKAVAVLCISAGTVVIAAVSVAWGLATTRSALNVGIVPAYLLVGLPAITDAWHVASGGDQTSLLGRGSKIYVLAMISITGPLALPLLWQSPSFTRSSKVVWTMLVAGLVVATVWALIAVAPMMDELLRELDTLQAGSLPALTSFARAAA